MRHDALAFDYGHGGFVGGKYQTNGKRYRFTDHGNFEVYEGQINRIVAAAIWGQIGAVGRDGHDVPRVFDVVAGREVDPFHHLHKLDTAAELCPYDVNLSHRVHYANRAWERYRAPLISVHTNAAGNTSAGPSKAPRGISVFTSPGDTASDKIADQLIEAFKVMEKDGGLPVRRGDWSDGDGDHEASFYMLTKTKGPAVLVEGGWFTNWADVSLLGSWRGVSRLAAGYVLGLTGEEPRATLREDRWGEKLPEFEPMGDLTVRGWL